MSNISKFSPTISGAVIAQFRAKDGQGNPLPDAVLDKMVTAANVAKDISNTIAESHKKIMANPMQTKLANMKASRDMAHRHMERIAKAIDTARADAVTEIESLDKQTMEPLTKRSKDPHDVQIAGEIRGWLRGMSHDERRKATEGMLKDGDDAGLSAILTAPASLSGLTKTNHDLLKTQYRQKKFPAEMNRLERLTKARDSLQQIGSVTMHHVLSLTDDKAIRTAEDLAKQAAEAAGE